MWAWSATRRARPASNVPWSSWCVQNGRVEVAGFARAGGHRLCRNVERPSRPGFARAAPEFVREFPCGDLRLQAVDHRRSPTSRRGCGSVRSCETRVARSPGSFRRVGSGVRSCRGAGSAAAGIVPRVRACRERVRAEHACPGRRAGFMRARAEIVRVFSCRRAAGFVLSRPVGGFDRAGTWRWSAAGGAADGFDRAGSRFVRAEHAHGVGRAGFVRARGGKCVRVRRHGGFQWLGSKALHLVMNRWRSRERHWREDHGPQAGGWIGTQGHGAMGT